MIPIRLQIQILVGVSSGMITAVGLASVIADRRFVQTPGDFAVLENTTAVFDWRHTILNLRNVTDHGVNKTSNNVAISWFYRGKNKERHNFIMSYSMTSGLYIASSDKAARLSYTEGLDSAVMSLNNVTFNDEGFYEVRVLDPTDPLRGGFYISDVALMTVIEATALDFNVTVRNKTFVDLDLANRSDIRLPSLPVSVPDRVYISISVSHTAPLSDIKMSASVGDATQPELPCLKHYMCEREIPLISETASRPEGLIQIDVCHNVQNLNITHINVPLELDDVMDSSEPTNPWRVPMIITCVIGMISIFFFTFSFILWLQYRRSQINLTGQTKKNSKNLETEVDGFIT